MTTFTCDPQLVADSHFVMSLPLSDVLLHKNAAFVWLMLVPRMDGMRDITDLPRDRQSALLDEINIATRVLKDLYTPFKMNVANLGNMVQQLHVHVIARYADDAAWPRPVWGSGIEAAYDDDMLSKRIAELRAAFAQEVTS